MSACALIMSWVMIMMLFPVTSDDRRLRLSAGRLVARQIVYGLALDALRRAEEHVHLVPVGQIADLLQRSQRGVLFDLEFGARKLKIRPNESVSKEKQSGRD